MDPACHNCKHWRREGRSPFGDCLGPFWRQDSYMVPDLLEVEQSHFDDRCDLHTPGDTP